MKYKLLILLIVIITPSKIFSENTVRVRILEKYRPKDIFISHEKSIYEKIRIDLKSRLPLSFEESKTHTIFIPSINFKRKYFGKIKILKGKNLVIVNTLPLKNYVTSVVISEFGINHPEAMSAQAVISRTWALSHIKPSKNWDFNDLTISQVYKGLTPYNKKVKNMTGHTDGEILTFKGEPVKIFFHAKCGKTNYSPYEIWGKEIPYLQKRETFIKDPYLWEASIKKSDLQTIFKNTAFKRYVRYKRHYVSAGEDLYPIDKFRLMVNRKLGWKTLKSNDFIIEENSESYIFKGRGHGHLVGFCQQAALKMAEKGLSYRKILFHFFKGCEIEKIY